MKLTEKIKQKEPSLIKVKSGAVDGKYDYEYRQKRKMTVII